MSLSKFIRSRIGKSEDKYVTLDIYNQHDKRFFLLRKHVLGDHFRGQREMTDDENENRADSDHEDAGTGTSQISEQETPPSIPISSNLLTNQSEQAISQAHSRIELNSLMEDQRNGNVSNNSTVVDSEPSNTNSTPHSIAGNNNIARNDENVPTANANKRKRPAGVLKIPSFSMELRRPISSNSVQVTPASDVRLDDSVKEKSENLLTDGIGSSIQQGTSTGNRKRGRPPKIDNAKKFKKSPSLAITDHNNMLDIESSGNKHADKDQRKRGRPRKTSLENETSNKSKSSPTNVGTLINDITRGQKRGRPRKTGLPIANTGNTSSTQVVDDKSYDENDAFAVEMYSKNTPMWEDPLNMNNYFYRSLLMIRLQSNQFQCSTCFGYIPSCKDLQALQLKFYHHYISKHTDLYQCKYCVGSQLESVYELQHHMAIYHPTCPPVELKTGGRKERKTSIYNAAPLPMKHSSSAQRRNCPICGMPVSSIRSLEYKKHYYTHMNAAEKRKVKRNVAMREPLSRTRKRGRTPKRLVGSQILVDSLAKAEQVKKPLVENVAPEAVDAVTETQSQQSKWTCTLCGVKVHNGASLRNHLKLQHNVCKYPDCRQSFETVRKLSNHILVDHIIIEVADYEHHCMYCGSAFRTIHEARNHTKQFKCEDVKAEISSMLEKISLIDREES